MSDENSSNTTHIGVVEKKLSFFAKNPVVSLSIIIGISLLLRFQYFPFGIPITLDGLLYFWYANDVSILGHLPPDYTVPNNGWPVFLSIFFSIFHSNNFMDYMVLQRAITLIISVLTIIPVYLLCTRFFDKPYALIGAAIFAFEPRIIQNSLLGITEPLYILLVTIALFLFFSENKKFVYVSFGITALASLVRVESLFLFIAFSIMFFVRFRKERRIIPKYALAVAIFVLILLPMVALRIQTTGNDELSGRIPIEVNRAMSFSSDNGKSNLFLFGVKSLENFTKFLGWSLIPVFIFFIPPGCVLIFKKRNHFKTTVIITIILLLIPAVYALSTASDTRYFLPLYPLFCVLSVLAIKFYDIKFKKHSAFMILLIAGILLSSSVFLDFKKEDIGHEKEALSLAYQVANRTSVINSYYPESGYITIAGMSELPQFPILHSEFKGDPVKQINLHASSLQEYIKLGKMMGLTHLVLDGTDNFQNRPVFFKDVFLHEEKYPYLIKIYDSLDHGYTYHLKIFKIDYTKFDSLHL